MTNFHSPAYRAMDIYADQADDLYADITPDHATFTDDQLLRRIERCRVIALDSITYGYNRSIAAKRIGEHAAAVLSLRKVQVAA